MSDVVVTIEHVFPVSWYPDGFPPSKMLTVPSCAPCNHSSGQREARIFLDLVSTLPFDPRTDSLVERAQRSANPHLGKSERDENARRKLGERLVERVTIVPPNAPLPPALWMRTKPEVGQVGETENGEPVIGFAVLHLPHELVASVIVKFLRCVYFHVYGEPLAQQPPPWVRSYTDELQEDFERFPSLPGTIVGGAFPFTYAIARTNGYVLAWFTLWDHLRYVACNAPRG